jgi:voltage-gated potassium channel
LKNNKPEGKSLRVKIFEVIFEADTPGGKVFDIILMWSIIISVGTVLLESIEEIRLDYGYELLLIEWFFTFLFTIEYILRLISVKNSARYALSFFGIVDLLAITPTYLSLLLPGGQYFIVIRILRLLRVFRIFKLTHFLSQADVLSRALKASRAKIIVFILTVLTIVVIIGSLMYVIEGPENGFTSIPTSIYWAIVTLTTVGYGDIAPNTPLGQVLASFVMLLGYSIIAVPTGIVTVELAEASKKRNDTQVCPNCLTEGHDIDAVYCKYCSHKMQL